MFLLLFKNFIRSRIALTSILLILVCGTVSILVGRQFLNRQENNIATTAAAQTAHLLGNAKYINSEMGLYLYYARFAIVNPTDKLSGISIGQRDLNPSIQSLTIRGLEAQKYDADLNNPSNLLSGNFDLSFVIIYLFPLLIITLSYNLLSEEKEAGTWRLVAASSGSGSRLLLQKLAVRALVVYGSLIFLLALAVVILRIPMTPAFWMLAACALLYCTFWMATSLWVVSLQKSSNTSALVLVSIWILLAVLLPAGTNSIVAARYPVPESFHTMIKQRDGYHEKFDMDKKETVEKLYAHYPQLKQYPLPNKSFSWLWYYAMQQMGDDESATEAMAMRSKLQHRIAFSRQIAAWVPTMQAQLQFSDLAQSGLPNHLAFLDATTHFHEQMRLYFYPKIFSAVPVLSENWASFTPTFFSAPPATSYPMQQLLPVSMLILILAAITYKNFKFYEV